MTGILVKPYRIAMINFEQPRQLRDTDLLINIVESCSLELAAGESCCMKEWPRAEFSHGKRPGEARAKRPLPWCLKIYACVQAARAILAVQRHLHKGFGRVKHQSDCDT